MSNITTTEVRPIAIERSQGGSLSGPTNNGIIINWGSGGGSAAEPSPSPASVVPNLLIPLGIAIAGGALLFQVIGQGISAFQNQQLQQQNAQLAQEKLQLQTTVNGVKQLVGCNE
jgi:hypothetical protein